MKTIHKYELKIEDEFQLSMPRGANVLKIDLQNNIPHLWAIVDTDQPILPHTIRCFGTGCPLPEDIFAVFQNELPNYIGTLIDGAYVWHYWIFHRVGEQKIQIIKN